MEERELNSAGCSGISIYSPTSHNNVKTDFVFKNYTLP